jgi:hypothetical protein
MRPPHTVLHKLLYDQLHRASALNYALIVKPKLTKESLNECLDSGPSAKIYLRPFEEIRELKA